MRIIKQDLNLHIYKDKAWSTVWYKNNDRHREDGPAEVWSSGKKYHHLNNIHRHEDIYWKEIHENY